MENQQSGGATTPLVDPMEPVVEFLKGTDPDLICNRYRITRAELNMRVEGYQNSRQKEVVADQLFMKRVGRNEPCPCGSGKKYKRCCMSQHEEARKAVPPDELQQMEEVAKAREKLDKDLGKGFQLLFAEELAKAGRLVEQLLALHPEDDRVYDLAVSVALAAGDYDSAHQISRSRWQVATEEQQFFQEHGYHKREGREDSTPVHFFSPSTWLEKLWIAQRARFYRNQFPQQDDGTLAGLVLQLKAANDLKRFPGRQEEGYEERKRALAPVLSRIEEAGEAAIPYVLPLAYAFSWASLFVPELLRAWGSDACLRLLGDFSMFRFPYFVQMCLSYLQSFGGRAVSIIDEILQRDGAFDELKGGLIAVLGNIHTPESFNILIGWIDHENSQLAQLAAQALEQHRNLDATPHLERAKARLEELSKIGGAIRDLGKEQ